MKDVRKMTDDEWMIYRAYGIIDNALTEAFREIRNEYPDFKVITFYHAVNYENYRLMTGMPAEERL